MAFEAVIFDMGGVLLEFDFDIYLQSFKEIGLNDIDKLADRYRQKGPFYEIEAGILSPRQFFDEIRKRLPQPLADEKIAETWCRFLKGIPQESLAAVKSIHKKVKTFVLSNSNPIHWSFVRDRYFPTKKIFNDYFDNAFLSFEMKKCKPDESVFEEVMQRIGCKPHEILFIDDGEENCRAAERCGWSVLMPNCKEEWIEFLANARL